MPGKKAETLELLLEAGRLLSSKLELDDLLAAVLELGAKVVDAETASLLLLDEKTQELYFHTALGLGDETGLVRLPLGQGIAGCVAQNRAPEIINEARSDPRWSPKMDEKSGFTTRSIVAVPMLLKGRLVGVVEAINKRAGAFSEEDLRTLEAFASQAAVALDNATLFSSLQEERRKLNTVFKEMTDGAILTDCEGRVLLANEAARKLLAVGTGLSSLSAALAGMAVTPPLPEVMSGPRASTGFTAPAGNALPGIEFTARREQPKVLILAGRVTRIVLAQAGQDEVPGWLFVLRDVTEETQKLALKSTFLSLISHKLKTPLASVTGFADILLDEFKARPPDPLVLQAAQIIAVQGRKLAALVEKLLRYTTLESPRTALALAPTPLDEVVAEALKSLKDWLEARGAAVVFKPAGVSVVGDRAFLGDVVKNLVENAVKFADKPEKKVAVQIETRDDQVLLSVRDNGPGIPPEEQDRVFSRFHQVEASFTGQIDGWGLGLPYVRKVVSLHAGEVRLASQLGKGTTVTVCLPRSRP